METQKMKNIMTEMKWSLEELISKYDQRKEPRNLNQLKLSNLTHRKKKNEEKLTELQRTLKTQQ